MDPLQLAIIEMFRMMGMVQRQDIPSLLSAHAGPPVVPPGFEVTDADVTTALTALSAAGYAVHTSTTETGGEVWGWTGVEPS